MKKKGYYEYENGIYPLKLWVHIGKDLKELIDSCFDGCNAPDSDYGGGYVCRCCQEERQKARCSCIVSVSEGYVDELLLPRSFSRLRCHRGSYWHGTRRRAFSLLGWIASCINNARLGIGDFVELKDKEE